MRTTVIGWTHTKDPHHPTGEYQIVYKVETETNKTGIALRVYKYDQNTILLETLCTSPEIAPEMIAFLGDVSPCDFFAFGNFPLGNEESQNTNIVNEAATADLVLVYWEEEPTCPNNYFTEPT